MCNRLGRGNLQIKIYSEYFSFFLFSHSWITIPPKVPTINKWPTYTEQEKHIKGVQKAKDLYRWCTDTLSMSEPESISANS